MELAEKRYAQWLAQQGLEPELRQELEKIFLKHALVGINNRKSAAWSICGRDGWTDKNGNGFIICYRFGSVEYLPSANADYHIAAFFFYNGNAHGSQHFFH